MQAHQSDVDHVSGYTGNGDAISNLDSIASDQEEIGGDGQNYGLKSDGQAGGDKARESCERAELAHEAEDDHGHDQENRDEPPEQQDLATPAGFANIPKGGAAPDRRESQ